MKLLVDRASRFAKQRGHTATHLLHAELNKIFPTTKQAGSLVDEDFLRFDFQAERMLSDEEISTIETSINQWIYAALTVTVDVMAFDDAKKLGAKAFFADKYGNEVRVVRVAAPETEGTYISVELCGGTHVSRTDEIGAFAIVSQEAVASGTKRIVAVTGRKVAELAQERSQEIAGYGLTLGVPTKQLDAKIAKVLKEHQDLSAQVESLQSRVLSWDLQKKFETLAPKAGFDGIVGLDDGGLLEQTPLKTVALYAASVAQGTFLLYKKDGSYAIVSSSDQAKDIAKNLGLQWGGSPKVVQGKDLKVLALI